MGELAHQGAAGEIQAPRPSLVSLAALSALILFLEMLLIRLLGTEVRVFAYLQNGVLVATFLGLGLGCRHARRPVRLLPSAVCLVLLTAFVRDLQGWGVGELLTKGLAAYGDSVVWAAGGQTGPRVFALATTLALLAAIAFVFLPLGQWLGRWMDEHPRPIAAYTANILGSLLGIVAFDVATVARTPPWTWLLAAGAGLAVLAARAEESRPRRLAAATLVLAAPVFGISAGRTVWSPYQKLTLKPMVARVDGLAELCAEEITVNSAFHQKMVDLDPARMRRLPSLYPPEAIRTSHYVLPYELLGPRERVLVLGAGSGNDVAAALRAGARSVRAVEIDPVILEWGRDRHPNRPYASPLVEIVNDDARAFLRRDHGQYDLVWFGFLDSHTAPSAYTNVRLDHFVYTRESFADVKRLLAPDGVVVLFFWAETPWIEDRLARLLYETFGARPQGFLVPRSTACLGHGGMMLVAGHENTLEAIRRRTAADPALAATARTAPLPLTAEATTDDWPYLYLERRAIPKYHLLVGISCLALALVMRRRLFEPGQRVDLPMMLLGAGFMLLEVTGVSRAALLYGTTWTVNAYVVGAILAMILVANYVAHRFAPSPDGWPVAGLAASLLALGLVPTAWLAGLDIVPRVAVGGVFLALPVLFSGLIFVGVWSGRPRRDLALGSNIIGSLLGGVASLLSMVVGFRALTFLTLAVYAAALVALRYEARTPASQSALQV